MREGIGQPGQQRGKGWGQPGQQLLTATEKA
jgi:hypothetical protein